jgi:hypothetical protein
MRRQTAFKERCKIHDLVLQGIELALRKRWPAPGLDVSGSLIPP